MAKVGSVTVELAPEFFAAAFVGHLAAASTPDLLEVAKSWQPDLILHESTEYGAIWRRNASASRTALWTSRRWRRTPTPP